MLVVTLTNQQADAISTQISFEAMPTFSDLAFKIEEIFELPTGQLWLYYTDAKGVQITIDSEEELEEYFLVEYLPGAGNTVAFQFNHSGAAREVDPRWKIITLVNVVSLLSIGLLNYVRNGTLDPRTWQILTQANVWFILSYILISTALAYYTSHLTECPFKVPVELRNVSLISHKYTPRYDTVLTLCEKLCKHRFVQVHGTPGSGKSTLALLLRDYIRRQEPDAKVDLITSWSRVIRAGGWEEFSRKQRYRPGSVIIVDEAQASFEDDDFWLGAVKDLDERSNYRIITFSSYGTPASRKYPMFLMGYQTMTLQPVDHKDGIQAIGLYLTKMEFREYIAFRNDPTRFDVPFLNMVFRQTSGHIGTIKNWLDIIVAHGSYRGLRKSGNSYTWALFQETFPPEKFLQCLQGGLFMRGLPAPHDLQWGDLAHIFRKVIHQRYVCHDEFLEAGSKKALEQCLERGWLQTENIDLRDQFIYFFTSPLHRWFMQAELGTLATPTNISENDLLDFVIKVISLFSPTNLSTEQTNGPVQVQRSSDARFQDEFYRCFWTYTDGSPILPSFGNSDENIDLFIPGKKWGIELLRDGKVVGEYPRQFSNCTKWAESTDYITLDFRVCTKFPCNRYPSLKKLYYVIFDDAYANVSIVNKELQEISRANLIPTTYNLTHLTSE